MTVSAPTNSKRAEEFSLSDNEFSFICKLVYDSSGIVLNDRKREMVYRRLMRRTRDLKLSSFSDYCQLLKNDYDQEFPNFINAITTNLTSFFRESHHFDHLRDTFIPEFLKNNQSTTSQKQRMRIWSSACSTGEEPYSIAITLMDTMGSNLSNWDVKILATDLDSEVLTTAQKSIYPSEKIDSLDIKIKKRWFHKGSGDYLDHVKVDPRLSKLIHFKQLNLLEPWPMKGLFDVIFCRNVLIYFDSATQEMLIPRYYELLKPNGLLFLGHSENIPKSIQGFECLGRTIFKKPPSKTHVNKSSL